MLLEVDHVRKQFRKRDGGVVPAVQDVSFQLGEGEILAFLGPNGAGKTTTIKMIAGLVRMDGGDVRIDGSSVRRRRRAALGHLGAVLEGSRNLYWRLTPVENFEYWAGIRGVPRRLARERGLHLLGLCGLAGKAKSTVQQLSRGQQQLVAICSALIHEPRLLLLDEPTIGLDVDASDRIQGQIERLAREEGVGILLTTHQMEVAERLSDRVVVLRQGSVVLEGATESVRSAVGGDAYVFRLAVEPDAERRAALLARGADFDEPAAFRIALRSADEFYAILHLLEPLPLLAAAQDTADLGTVFRRYAQPGGGEAAR